MEKEKIRKLSLAVASRVVDSSQKIVFSWTNELKVLKNLNITDLAYAGLLIDSVVFGHYYVGEKVKAYMDTEEAKIFSDELTKYLCLLLSLMLDSPHKDKNSDAHKNAIRELYLEHAPEKLQALANYKGDTILDLFKEGLRQDFNSNDFKIKFIENTFITRLKLKIASLFTEKYRNDMLLDSKIIYALSDALFMDFSSMDYNQLVSYADELLLF